LLAGLNWSRQVSMALRISATRLGNWVARLVFSPMSVDRS